jgi:hypothetical protein
MQNQFSFFKKPLQKFPEFNCGASPWEFNRIKFAKIGNGSPYFALEMAKLFNPLAWGGTGFQPVVSGILPETKGAYCQQRLSRVRTAFVRPKSGATPDLTGWKPVPPSSNYALGCAAS